MQRAVEQTQGNHKSHAGHVFTDCCAAELKPYKNRKLKHNNTLIIDLQKLQIRNPRKKKKYLCVLVGARWGMCQQASTFRLPSLVSKYHKCCSILRKKNSRRLVPSAAHKIDRPRCSQIARLLTFLLFNVTDAHTDRQAVHHGSII